MTNKKIFISYRRSDSAGHAGRLYDYLKNYFGDEWIFFDVNTIGIGTKFDQRIKSELESSDAVLVLIGTQWLDIKDANGNRRLDDPDDYVRLEVEIALSKDIVVIPVLLQSAPMPSDNALPEKMYELSKRNAIKLNDDHWASDLKNFTLKLKKALGISRSPREDRLRRIRHWILILSILGSILAVIRSLLFGPISGVLILVSVVVQIWYPAVLALDIVLVTYLLGNTKRELNRPGWIIIFIAFIALIFSIIDRLIINESLTYIPSFMLLAAAWLFNFVEPDNV